MAERSSGLPRLLDEASGAKGRQTGGTVIPLCQISRRSIELCGLNRSFPIPVSEQGLERDVLFVMEG